MVNSQTLTANMFYQSTDNSMVGVIGLVIDIIIKCDYWSYTIQLM